VALVVAKQDAARGRELLEGLLSRDATLDRGTRAMTQFRLAELLVDHDSKRARALAAEAFSAIREIPVEAELRAEIEAWTAKHGPTAR